MTGGGEISGEFGVEGRDLGDILINFLDQGHVLDHVVGDLRLVVLVDLLD